MKQRMMLFVRGKHHDWGFEFDGHTELLDEWREDGLDIVVLEATIPLWVASPGLAQPYAAVQRLWRWLRFW
jgi:hypothetical protein